MYRIILFWIFEGESVRKKESFFMSKYYDITVPISSELAVYQGDPPVKIEPLSSIADDDPYNINKLEISTHTGTHVDAPNHYFKSGKTVDQIPLDTLIGTTRVILIRGHRVITRELLEKENLDGVTRLLIKTDHSYLLDRYSKFRSNFCHLDVDACGYLVSKGIKIVGIDTFSIEQFESQNHMCHKVLLGAGVVIIEMVDLKAVEPGDYVMTCLPLKVEKGDGAPSRIILADTVGEKQNA